jgi:hypothetical protein
LKKNIIIIEIIASVLPSNSFELAITDAKHFFHEEIPSIKFWIFTKNQAKDMLHKKVLYIRRRQNSRKISNIEKIYSIIGYLKLLQYQYQMHLI